MGVGDVLELVRRRRLPFLVGLVFSVACAVAVTAVTPTSYRASTRLLVNPKPGDVSEALLGVQLSSQLFDSYTLVATSRSSSEAMLDRMGLVADPDEVRHRLSLTADSSRLVLTLSVTDRDASRARTMADTAALVFTGAINEIEHTRRGEERLTVIDAAERPSTPISPRPSSNVLMGIVAGLLLGATLAFASEALDRRVTTTAALTALLGVPVLGVAGRVSSRRAFLRTSTPSSREPYRSLRTALQFVHEPLPLTSILVTSPGAREGATTAATQLARTLADSGARVVLVDAHLRHRRHGRLFDVEPGPGLTSVLSGEVDVSDVLVRRDGVDLLLSGPLPPNSSDLLGSQAMADVIASLARVADVVLLDAPPVLDVTDAAVLSTQVDGVVLVVHAGRSSGEASGEALRLLESVGANVVGCFLTGASPAVANGQSRATLVATTICSDLR